jgi:hypothetical protein
MDTTLEVWFLMSENENQSPEDEENPKTENESIIELVEKIFDEMDECKTLKDLPEIDKEEFGVPESEEDHKKFRLKTKDEIIQKIKEIFNDSNSWEQQRKKYRLELIKIVEDYILCKIFGELNIDNRRTIFASHINELDVKDFESFEKETYFDIVQNQIEYYVFLSILREEFWDGMEESFPSKLTYQLKEYGRYLYTSCLNEDTKLSDYLDEKIAEYNYEIDIEKKFLSQYGDEEFRNLFEFGFNEDLVSRN